MLTEVIKLDPKLDEAGTNKMFNQLNKRFANVAKTFGKGMAMAAKAAPFLAIAGTILAKILNPLERAESIIDKILGNAGDITDAAEELDTSPGKLARLEALGRMKGVDENTMRTLLGKFQTDLAQERANFEKEQLAVSEGRKPDTRPGLLRNFVGEKDTAQAFFDFIQSLQNLTPEARTLAQTQVFGERIRGRASPFFNERNYTQLLSQLPTVEQYNTAIAAADMKGDRLDVKRTVVEEFDKVSKSFMVKDSMIDGIVQGIQQRNAADTQELERYQANKDMSIAVTKIIAQADKFFTGFLNDFAPKILDGINAFSEGVKILTPYLEKFKDFSFDVFDSILEGIGDIAVKIENLTESFKSSSIYKFFGGGKK